MKYRFYVVNCKIFKGFTTFYFIKLCTFYSIDHTVHAAKLQKKVIFFYFFRVSAFCSPSLYLSANGSWSEGHVIRARLLQKWYFKLFQTLANILDCQK